jgi:hypothetical protein
MATGYLLDLVREHRDEVQAAVERHRGLSFTVFGSVARGEETDASDRPEAARHSRGVGAPPGGHPRCKTSDAVSGRFGGLTGQGCQELGSSARSGR